MRILVFQHVSVEHPGIFRDFWNKNGDVWHPVEINAGEPIPKLEEFDLLVAMGGPMDVWQEDLHPWLIEEKRTIRTWVVDLGRPFLGICLGHQLLAAALGGRVSLMKSPEVGLVDVDLTPEGLNDPIFAGFSSSVETFQWHGAEISFPPAGTTLLASNAECQYQAIRWGRHAYGFQYHVEITPATVAEWSAIPEYKASLELALGPERAAGLADMVAPRLPSFREAAQRMNENLSSIISADIQFRNDLNTGCN